MKDLMRDALINRRDELKEFMWEVAKDSCATGDPEPSRTEVDAWIDAWAKMYAPPSKWGKSLTRLERATPRFIKVFLTIGLFVPIMLLIGAFLIFDLLVGWAFLKPVLQHAQEIKMENEGEIIFFTNMPTPIVVHLVGSIVAALAATGALVLSTRKYVESRIGNWVSSLMVDVYLLLSVTAILYLIMSYAEIYQYFGLYDGTAGGGKSHRFTDALYFSIVTWTTLGYGDFTPTSLARPFAASEALLGYVFMGLLIVGLISYLAKD